MADTIPSAETKSWFHWGPHIPLTILLVIFLITNGSQTVGIIRQNIALRSTENRFLQSDAFRQLTVAEGISDRLDALVDGLRVLAPANADARHVLQEFNISAPTPEGKSR
jgi:hypothetical protein